MRLLRWSAPGVAVLCLALPTLARAGVRFGCERPEFAWQVTVSGAPADREIATRLTSAALLQSEGPVSVTVADEFPKQEPSKRSCVARASVKVARSASSVAVEATVRRFERDAWSKEENAASTGPGLVEALEDALSKAGVRSAKGVPLVALLPPPPCAPVRAPTARALLVGVNEYAEGKVPSLHGAVRDTSLIEGALLSRYPGASVAKLLDRAATRAGLHRELTALVEASQCGDIVFIHYSGHASRGAVDGSDDIERWDAGRLVLVLSDQKVMGESALRGFVTALRNRRAFVVVTLDTNHTAGVNLGSAWRHSAEDGVELLRGAGDCAVMTAGAVATEYSFPEGPAGVFSLAVALALKKEGGITVRSMASAVADNTRQLTKDKGIFAIAPFFEASNPDARLLPGSSDTSASLEVRLDGEQAGRGAALLETSPEPASRKVIVAGTVAGAEPLSAFLVNGTLALLGPGGRFQAGIDLPPGPQKVQFVGVRNDLSLATVTREVQVGAESAAPPGQGYALLIGIQRYEKWSPLQTPIADVREVGRVLRERYGFATTLASFGDLVLENPDKVQIGSAFAALRRALGPSDSLVVYYAGHGKAEGTKERRRGFWIPRDADQENRATWYSGQDLLNEIADMKARHVLVVSDSCFSGDLTRDKPNPPADLTEAERQRRLAERAGRASRILITSGYDEPVLDGGGSGHSVFAQAFLDGLERIQDERFLSFDLFSRFIDQQVGGKSPQQPHHLYLQDSGHDGGDMPFARRKGVK